MVSNWPRNLTVSNKGTYDISRQSSHNRLQFKSHQITGKLTKLTTTKYVRSSVISWRDQCSPSPRDNKWFRRDVEDSAPCQWPSTSTSGKAVWVNCSLLYTRLRSHWQVNDDPENTFYGHMSNRTRPCQKEEWKKVAWYLPWEEMAARMTMGRRLVSRGSVMLWPIFCWETFLWKVLLWMLLRHIPPN